MIDESDTTNFRLIPTSTIPDVSSVRFYDETVPHLGEGHPEMRLLIPSIEGAIADAIENPTTVVASNPPYKNAFRFCSSNHLYQGNQLVVAVKVIEGTSGLLKTAFFTNTVPGKVVWSSNND